MSTQGVWEIRRMGERGISHGYFCGECTSKAEWYLVLKPDGKFRYAESRSRLCTAHAIARSKSMGIVIPDTAVRRTAERAAMSERCKQCEERLPGGCLHFYGSDPDCPVGPNTSPEWIAGRAAWDSIADRRGARQELDQWDTGIKVEAILDMGKAILKAQAATASVVQAAKEEE